MSPRTTTPAATAMPDAPAAPDPGRRPWWRRLLRLGVWSLVGLLLLVAGLAFVASRTVTLQWATQQMIRFADGRLQVEGITGSVLTGISADYLQWQDGPLTVAITSPRFTYHPFAMLDGLVRIESISAANVEVDLPANPGPAQSGESFRLPPAMASMLPVAIERVDLGRLVVRRGGTQLANLRDLELAIRHDGDRINARLHDLTVVAGDSRIGVRGDASVLARAPYATDGRLSVRLPLQPQPLPLPLRLDVRIHGPIEELTVRATTVMAGATIDARTMVHTLDSRPLRQVRVDVKDLDLSLHDPSLPGTSLSGTYVAEVMPVWASERRPLLIGPLNLTNAQAAPLDRNRLPVAQAKAVVGYVDGGFQLQGLQADGPIGELTGEGWVGPDSVKLALGSDRLNLQALHSSLAPRTLKARIAVGREAEGRLRVEATAADASLAAELEAVLLAGRQLQVSRAQVQFKGGGPSAAGRASFLGTVGLTAPWPIDLSGTLRNLDPAQLAAAPSALLNGTWRLSGRMAGDGGAGLLQAYLSLDESRFRDLPLSGRLAATASVKDRQLQRLSAVHGALRWGSGTIEAAGALGGAQDVLRIQGRELTGAAAGLRLSRVEAVVEGSRADHRIEVDADGAGQHLAVTAKGALEDGAWRGVVERLAVSHPLLEMPGAAGPGAATARAPAGTDPAKAGPAPSALRSLKSFDLAAGSGRVTARNGRFDLHGARLDLKQADWREPMLALSADASGLAARWLGRFLPVGVLPREGAQDLTLSASLEFAGNLELADGAGWRGAIRMQREQGDLVLAAPGGGAPAPAGLSTLQASLSMADRRVELVMNLDGEHIGRMAVEARSRLPGGAPALSAASIARSTLDGRLDLAVNSFGWIPRLAEESWLVDGALSARLQLGGTLGSPRAQGAVTGSNLSAEEKALGMRLSNGVLAAELIGDRIDVRLLRFESGTGSVAVSGLLKAAGAQRSQARVVLDRLPIPLGSGQRVVLSGSTTATLAEDALDVSGRLVADEGIIELDAAKAPTEGTGVAVPDTGGSRYPDRNELAEAAARPVADRSARTSGPALPASDADAGQSRTRGFGIDTDIEVDLGRRFRVVGSGLDTNLKGAIRLRGHYPVATHATGTVDLAHGSYRVHGRRLRIDRGRIVFDGLLDDPALDIVAVRDNLKVEPGVWIGGTAAAPVVRLVSTPDVPDADKLAWLVLGDSVAATRGAGQQRALQRAATALFGDEAAAAVAGLDGRSGSEPSLRTRETGVAGVDAAYSPGAVAMVGRRLGARLSETYGQSLRGVWSILKLQYEITDRLSLSARAGSDGAAALIRLVPED